MNRVLGNAVTVGNIGDRGTGFMLFQDRDNLFFGIALALHAETSLGQNYREIPLPPWLGLRGYGHFRAR